MSDVPTDSDTPAPPRGAGPRAALLLIVGLVVVTAAATFGLTALLLNISGHKQEEKNPFYRVVELTDETEDPAVWGKNFPQQYDGYLKTAEMRRTRFGGSESVARTPSSDDPREAVSRSKVDADPRLKTIWAGYAFAVDYRERRGHAYMLIDQMFTQRQRVKQQPGTCIHCHGSVYVPYKAAGNGDLIKGFEALNHLKYEEARTNGAHPVKYPLACIDCHDPRTMQLRVTRPGFLEGIRALKASEGKPDYDPNRDATRQQMRTFVCAQCHVEYYFRGDEKRLVYPWSQGNRYDDMLKYFDETQGKDGKPFSDWTHKLTGAPLLKAQHPEFETWSQGTHAKAGVACADCHMPYARVGALKISDHHVRSPLLNINHACQTCHHTTEADLLARATLIQDRTRQLEDIALDALVDLIADIQAARKAGATDAQLGAKDGPWAYQRKAQYFVDLVCSENSMGFHAPQETARALAQAIDWVRRGQVAVRALTTPARPK
ncbi:MAG: ammonia-forming cytochrome c nitrite reductase subunit c552 [Armatimonadetes bacterium]|nr:ammonia-forming cytochrome c nitrite reductase subunit c552 [Armatimonadota bacterium]